MLVVLLEDCQKLQGKRTAAKLNYDVPRMIFTHSKAQDQIKSSMLLCLGSKSKGIHSNSIHEAQRLTETWMI